MSPLKRPLQVWQLFFQLLYRIWGTKNSFHCQAESWKLGGAPWNPIHLHGTLRSQTHPSTTLQLMGLCKLSHTLDLSHSPSASEILGLLGPLSKNTCRLPLLLDPTNLPDVSVILLLPAGSRISLSSEPIEQVLLLFYLPSGLSLSSQPKQSFNFLWFIIWSFSLIHYLLLLNCLCPESSSQDLWRFHEISKKVLIGKMSWDFRGGSAAKMPHSQCRRPGFKTWVGN